MQSHLDPCDRPFDAAATAVPPASAPGGEPRVCGVEPAHDVHVARPPANAAARYAWGTLGTLALGMGVVGVALPGWPTTIFLIAAAACYARSSQRMYDRILSNRLFGRSVRRFRETGSMPLRAKAFALGLMWPFVAFAALYAIPGSMLWAKAATLLLALAGTAYIFYLPTDQGLFERSDG